MKVKVNTNRNSNVIYYTRKTNVYNDQIIYKWKKC